MTPPLVVRTHAQAVIVIDGDENYPDFVNSGFTILRDGGGKTLLVGVGRGGDSGGTAEKEVTAGGDTGEPLAAVNHAWPASGLEAFESEYDPLNTHARMKIGSTRPYLVTWTRPSPPLPV